MKILHTSDWHLGKKLEGKSRIEEQRAVLEELLTVCNDNNVDIVLVAGDVFDSVNPPAEAEELFYRYALRLSEGRQFVAIAGNHDNAERLKAPASIAAACDIILVGAMDNCVYSKNQEGEISREGLAGGSLVQATGGSLVQRQGGEGFIKFTLNSGEKLNLALLPYPSAARMSGLGYKSEHEEYYKNAEQWLKLCAQCYGDGYNVLCSHLFMANSIKSDEYELGTAALLPTSVLPICDYVALGHVHKPQKVSSKANAYYSGSILNYSFDESGEKYFNLVELKTERGEKTTEITKIPIKAGRQPQKLKVKDFEEAKEGLKNNGDKWISVLYDNAEPLSSAKVNELRSFENFCGIVNIFKSENSKMEKSNVGKSDKDMFLDFYKLKTGKEPESELLDMFLEVVAGEGIK